MAGADSPSGAQVSYRRQYRRCGKAACSRCASGGPGHGPYWYAYWWEGGRSRSRYLGTQAPAAGTPVAPETDDSVPAPAVRSAIAALRVRTLGGFAVWRGDAAIGPEQWAGQRAITLFKCLLSAPGRRLSREQAIDVLWPGGDPATCASNLRTTVYLLRQVLDGPDPTTSRLRTEGTMLTLAPAGDAAPPHDWLDAAVFAQAAAKALAGQDAAACRAALAWYNGDYLPDDPYEEWAVQPRDTLRRLYLQLLQHLAMLCATQGEQEEAELCLRRVLTAEPSQEDAAATLMGLLAATGRRHEALRVYQALATVLEEELDVAPTAEIMALRIQLLAQEAAPLATGVPVQQSRPVRLTNLPLALTSFVGRAWEVTEIAGLLARTRLVTLTGPGGAGKTRLAFTVAEGQVEGNPHGVWVVELAALADPGQVPRAVAAALGVIEQADQPVLDTLTDFLQPRRLLLVLDNCEHLIAACADLAYGLLQTCPNLRMLATSREGLAVVGEHTYRVPSLSAPDSLLPPPLEQLYTYEAVQLFLERARTPRPDLVVTAGDMRAIAQICARLDGLPLAIELAAARVSSLPIAGIASRLDDCFRLLTGGPRTALPRQQALRATLDWSYGLLSELERILLRRLAVFSGGWIMGAAEAVCAGHDIARADVADLLGGLVHKSLILLEDRDAETRYRLLETVRQYALEKLEAAGELVAVRDRHLEWCVALGEKAVPSFRGPQQLVWLDRLELEHDNLRGALHWSTEHPSRAEAGVTLAGAIAPLWSSRGYIREGRRWLEEMLARAPAAPTVIRARALFTLHDFARILGDSAQARAFGDEGLAAYREVGDPVGRSRLLVNLAWGETNVERSQMMGEEALALAREAGSALATSLALGMLGAMATVSNDLAGAQIYYEESLALGRIAGDRTALASILKDFGTLEMIRGAYERAEALFDECLALEREMGRSVGLLLALASLGQAAFYRRDHERAASLLDESMTLSREIGDRTHLISTLEVRGRLALLQGNYAQAATLVEQGMSLAGESEDRYYLGMHFTGLGNVALAQGDFTRAIAMHRKSLGLFHDMGLPDGSTERLEGLALALGAYGDVARAAWLLGAAEAARERYGAPLPPPNRDFNNPIITTFRGALSEQAWQAAWTAGQATTLEVAVSHALEACPVTGAGEHSGD